MKVHRTPHGSAALGLGAALCRLRPRSAIGPDPSPTSRRRARSPSACWSTSRPTAHQRREQPDGYDADVAKLLAKDLGVKANIVPVTGPNRIPFLLTNKVDMLVASLA